MISNTGAAATGLEYLLTAAATKISLLCATAPITDALPMFDPRFPIGAAVIDVDRPVHSEIVSAPIDPAAPIVSTRRPTPESVPSPECNSRRDNPGADIARRRKVVWRVIRIWPAAVYNGGVVIRDIDRIGVRWLNRYDLSILHLSYSDGLLFGRCQLVVRLCLGAQALDGIHHIRLLGKNRIT